MTVKQKNAVSAATAELPYFDAPYAEGLDHEDLLQNPRLLTEVLPVAESALWGGWEDPDHSTVRSDEDHLPIQEALLAFHAAGHDAVYVDAAQSDEDDEGGIILQDQFLPFLGWLAISAAGAHAAGPTSYEVSGRILLGPITDASGLSVGIFRADGVALNGKGVVFSAGGRYSIEVQDPYAGVVVLRVIDATTGADFLDEAERKVLDMTQDYRALGVVDGVNNVVIDINAMTEMIAVFLGLTSGNEGASSVDVLDNLPADIDLTQVDLTTVVEQTVSKVEAWLGLVPGDLSKPAEAVILDNDKPNPDVNLTGQFLAVVSGLTATTGESSQAVIERLVADLRNEAWSDDLVRDVVVAAERAGAVALDVGTALGWMPDQVEQVTTSWRVIETAATSPEAPRPTETDYRNLGVNFSSLPAPTDALASLVGSALTVRTQAPPDSVAELRDLVNSSARLYGTMTGDTTVATVTIADLNQLGIENVTQEQLPTVVELLTQVVPTDQPVPAVQELAKQIAVAIALFDLNPLTNTVRENAAGDTPVGITARAKDADASSSITYSLSQNEGGFFKIDEKTGVVSTTNVLINCEVDGATRTIEVTATRTDASGVTQTSKQNFVIAVADENEFEISVVADANPQADVPASTGLAVHGLVTENAEGDTRVGITASATDADASSVIRYSLSQNEGGFFKIDEKTGVVSTTDVLINREVDGATRTIEVTATSTDEIGAKQTSKQRFVIAVADQNEFEVSALTDSDVTADVTGVSSGTVAENAAADTLVGITARAKDADASSSITYSLSQNEGGFFKIDEKTGVVSTTNVRMNREVDGATRTIEVTAASTDEIGAKQTSKHRFVIAVADQNEFEVSALMDSDVTADVTGVSSGAVAENAAADTLVGITARATDADASSVIRYSLSQNEGGFFKIDETTGVVSTTNVLINREVDGATRSIEITATSTDESGATQTSRQIFVIAIADQNEFAASTVADVNSAADALTSAGVALHGLVAENATENTVVGITARATDTDASSVITYSLSDDANGRFQIGAASGVVTTTGKAIDREADDGATRSIEVTATSTDESGVTQNSKQRYVIAVTDQNEFAVSAVTDGNSEADALTSEGAVLLHGLVWENASENTRVGITASATDADASSVITYSLSQNEGGFFKIDETTGVVSTTNVLINREVDGAIRSIEVTATSTDESGAIQTSKQRFVIAVADQNEFEVSALNDSDVTADVAELSSGAVNENAAENMRVGITTRATDADASSVITYSLSQNEGGFFKIDEKSGVVTTTTTPINREVDGAIRTIEVTATSTDESGAIQASKQRFVIAVADQNEFEVSALMDSDVKADIAGTSSGAVAENADADTLVGITASATDADASSVIRYSLSQNEGGFFKIDEKSGVVSTTSIQINRETHGATRTIEVTATSTDESGAEQTSQQSFVIAIADLNEFAVSEVIDLNALANDDAGGGTVSHGRVTENADADTLVGITTRATDADASSVITYSLSQNEGGFFKVDEKSGVVTTTTTPINREVDGAIRTIEVTATSTDESGAIQTSKQRFVIAVADQNEFEVSALMDSDVKADIAGTSSGAVAENADADTLVGITAKATDADASSVITYSLSQNEGGFFKIDEKSGVVSTTSVQINREMHGATRTIEVTATSTDESGAEQTSQQSFVIQIDNVFETRPLVISNPPSSPRSFQENIETDSEAAVVARLQLLGGDSAPEGKVEWKMAEGDDTRFFTLTQDGTVRLNRADFEAAYANGDLSEGYETLDNHYTIKVQAQDQHGNLSQEVTLTVVVTDDDDEALPGDQSVVVREGVAAVPEFFGEGVAAPAVIGVATFVNAIGMAHWALSGPDVAHFGFKEGKDTGLVRLTFTAPDYEAEKAQGRSDFVYKATLTGTDDDGNQVQKEISLTLENVNFNIVGMPNEPISIDENTATDSEQAVVARLSVGGDQHPVNWSMTGDDKDRFEWAYDDASKAWVLRLKQADYEGAWENGLPKPGAESNDNDYTVTVAADDGWGHAHEVSVRVRVADVEEHSSEQRVDGLVAMPQSVVESVQPTLLGTPRFFNALGPVTWDISPDATRSSSPFYKDEQGRLWFSAADYEDPQGLVEDPQSYRATLTGTDQDGNRFALGLDIRVSDRPLVINLAPSDEVAQAEATVTQSDGSRVSTWRVVEHRADNTTRHAIGTVSLDALASDDAHGSLVWTLDSGYGDHALFELNPDGSLSLQAMDYETLPDSADGDKVYEVRLVATDRLDGTAIQTNTHVVKVEVQDDDAEPADFKVTGLEATYTRDENIAVTDAGALLGTVSVAPGGVYNGEITWRLRGDDQDRFALDTQTGELRLKPQNYEEFGTDNVHHVTVVGTDSDHNEQSTEVVVNLANVRELRSFDLTVNGEWWFDLISGVSQAPFPIPIPAGQTVAIPLGVRGEAPEGLLLATERTHLSLDYESNFVDYTFNSQTNTLLFETVNQPREDYVFWGKLEDQDGNQTPSFAVFFMTFISATAPILNNITGQAATGTEDTEWVEITLADLIRAGDGHDPDEGDSIRTFFVEKVNTGTLKIGSDWETATDYAENNDVIGEVGADIRKAFWTPEAHANGMLSAFQVRALDGDVFEVSSPPPDASFTLDVLVQVTPAPDAPVITSKEDSSLSISKTTTLISELLSWSDPDENGAVPSRITVEFTSGYRSGVDELSLDRQALNSYFQDFLFEKKPDQPLWELRLTDTSELDAFELTDAWTDVFRSILYTHTATEVDTTPRELVFKAWDQADPTLFGSYAMHLVL